VLAVLMQAGRGLAAAHAADLVHRDFKPENVLVGRDGRARVGDFGLATATATATMPASSPTLVDTEPLAPLERGSLTHLGVVIGTPLYMAPEQHLGAPVDPRTDQFSFCVTLYRALFGKHPFVGDTREALVRSILAGAVVEPGREARVPRTVVRALRRGLAARPPDRHSSMQALLDELERGSRRRVGLWLASAAGAGLVAAGAAFALMGEPATPSPEREPEVVAAPEVLSQPLLRTDRRQQLTFSGDAFLPQLTADGRFLAFVAVAPLRSRLIVQELATGTAQTLSWWRRVEDIRWSPDETRILVRSDQGISIVPRDEGRRMVHAHAAFAAWSADGHALVLADLPRQLRIRDLASSKERAVPLTSLPAGSTIAGLDWSAATDRLLLLVSDVRGWSLWTLRPDGGELRRVFSDSESVRAVNPRWTTDGGSLTYHRVSTSGRELALLRVPTDGVATELGPLLRGSDASLDYSLARDGRSIAHVQEQHDDNVVLLNPGAPDAEARFEHLTTGSQLKSSVVPGRDAIAFVVGPAWEADQLFVVARTGGPPRQLTREPAAIHSVAWAPDGQSLAYTRRGSEGLELWRVELTSAEERRIAVPGLELQGDLLWASERALLCRERSEDAAWHVVDPVTGSRRPLVDPSAGRIEQIRAAPDGSQVAVMWSRKDRTDRLWKLSLVDDTQVELSERYVWPIGWSDDGSTVYASDFRDPRPQDLRDRGGDERGGAPDPHGARRAHPVRRRSVGPRRREIRRARPAEQIGYLDLRRILAAVDRVGRRSDDRAEPDAWAVDAGQRQPAERRPRGGRARAIAAGLAARRGRVPRRHARAHRRGAVQRSPRRAHRAGARRVQLSRAVHRPGAVPRQAAAAARHAPDAPQRRGRRGPHPAVPVHVVRARERARGVRRAVLRGPAADRGMVPPRGGVPRAARLRHAQLRRLAVRRRDRVGRRVRAHDYQIVAGRRSGRGRA
jgi:Tol biopolymer transport system component